MTYNYLSIVNKVLGSFNEVKFSTETDFNNATGFQLDMREALNDILIEIYNIEAQEWPFLKTSTTQVVTPGVTAYSPPAEAATVDWDSFYIDTVIGTQNQFTSVTADAGTKTFTITSGSFLTQGFAVGMKVRWTGLTDNSATDVTITTLTDTVMTVSETVVDASSTSSFSVKNAFDGYNSSKLDWMPIDTYRNNYLKSTRDATETTSYRKPTFIARDTNNNFITGPLKPDATYLIRYDYFQGFTPLTAATDVPLVPEIYEYVILAGMKRRGNEFRDNTELAALFNKQFEDGIKAMRNALIPFVNTLRYEP